MFSHDFTQPVEESPAFKEDGKSFRIVLSENRVIVEYLGKTYDSHICSVGLTVSLNSADGSSPSKHEFSFNYEFSRSTPWYSVSVGPDISSVNVSILVVKSLHPFIGLINYGATCYINAFIQSLYFISSFKQRVYESDGYHSFLLQRLFYRMDHLNNSIREHASPAESALPGSFGDSNGRSSPQDVFDSAHITLLKDSLSGFLRNLTCVVSVNTHQDIHEFSKFLFDHLEADSKQLTEIIEGRFSNVINCSCGCVLENSETFQDIQLGVSDGGVRLKNVYESLDALCKEETIDSYCCKDHGDVSVKKALRFSSLPDVLFVLIKRFEMDMETFAFSKHNDLFEFPEDLDMSSYTDDATDSRKDYDLYGILVHSGATDEGHYYCYLKINGNYYKFNDTTVYEASKEEAIERNFGGKHPYDGTDLQFSAYYLIYMRKGLKNTVDFELWKDRMATDEGWFKCISSLRETVVFKYLSNRHIQAYNGPGWFNLSDYSYPIVIPGVESCYEFDNVSKLIPGKKVYDAETFRQIRDEAVNPATTYFIADHGTGKLVFIKLFEERLWCTYPQNLIFIGAFRITSLEELKSYSSSENCLIFREASYRNGSQVDVKDNKRRIIKGASEELEAVIHEYSMIEEGDVLILTSKEEELKIFMKEFRSHRIVNAAVRGIAYPVFLRRGLTIKELEEALQNYFCSRQITINGTRGKLLQDSEGGIKDTSAPMETILNNTGMVECSVGNNSVIYAGIENGCVDINLIKHIHLFLLPQNATTEDLLCKFRLSTAVCMAKLQGEADLQVVESTKDSLNVRLLLPSDILQPSNNFLIIQKKMKNPLKIAFYTGSYHPVNYPFMIENPKTIMALREQYFFAGRIVRFDGYSHHECSALEVLDLSQYEVLLIEKK